MKPRLTSRSAEKILWSLEKNELIGQVLRLEKFFVSINGKTYERYTLTFINGIVVSSMADWAKIKDDIHFYASRVIWTMDAEQIQRMMMRPVAKGKIA